LSSGPSDWNKSVIEEFRANDGRIGGHFQGAPVLLLHTTGARSGQARVHPVMYLDVDGRRFVFATKAGAPTNPDWYHNLIAHPSVKVEVGTDTISVKAVPVQGADHDRIYAEQVRRFPSFGEYQEKTERVIPVVELTAEE
jgi:deazaflavin-dependent oxidoreductase (nitroreductase family)